MQIVPRLTSTFKPDHYQLSIDIDREALTFRGTVTIRGFLPQETNTIPLHAKDLTIETALIDGKTASWSTSDFDGLDITQPGLAIGEHVVVIGFNGVITSSMHGMYPCTFSHDGTTKQLIATQFESHHAREVFPCIDEPEAKATFDLTLTTELGVTVLSNLHPTHQREENGRLVTTFATTPRMSTYLLAWVYGELHKKTAHTSNDIEVNVYATPAQPTESLDFALDHAVKTIEFFDEYFGVPYPLPKSDHVALPDFSSGAMENWGLVTYRESCLLANPRTTSIASKQQIASVISHELSHQWFGNLVTMQWWDDLWLNESFATLMSYIAVDTIHPEWNTWLDFSNQESILALRRDAIDGVQAVQVDVHHPDEISSLFDPAIVYAKGARLMRMCQTYIGDEAFRRGLSTYFTEFAYQNTVAADLWKHLSEASGKDIHNFMTTWIAQPGYPVLFVEPTGLRQERFFIGPHESSQLLWPIPLLPTHTETVPSILSEARLSINIAPDERFNRGDCAHFITQYPADHLKRLLADSSQSELDRLQLLNEQSLLVRGGFARSDALIDLLEHYRNETSQHVWEIMSLALSELKKFVEYDRPSEDQLRTFASRLARPLYETLGWTVRIGEPESDTMLRSIILGFMVYSQDPEVVAHAQSLFDQGIEHLDPEIRSLVMSSVVYQHSDLSIAQQLLERYAMTTSVDLQGDIADSLTGARDPEQIRYLIDNLTNTAIIRPQDNARWFVYLIRNRYSREATWQWLVDNWQWIEQQFGGDKSFDYYPRYAASGVMTRDMQAQYKTFFDPKRSVVALTRVIDLGLLEIEGRLELIERDGDAVRSRLKSLS